MDIGRDDWIGLRVARYRTLAGMTQQQLADKVGCDRTHVAHIEGGRRALDRRDALIAFAEALKVAVTTLTAQPAQQVRNPAERVIHDAVPAMRAALDGALDPDVRNRDMIAASVDAVMAARMACSFDIVGTNLAPTIASALHVAEAAGSSDEDQHNLARVCVAAALALKPLGYVDLAARFADRAALAAAHAGMPTAIAAAEYTRAQVSLAGGILGLRQRSFDLAYNAAANLNHSTEDERAWYGLLNLHAALSAASLGGDPDVHLAEAVDVAPHVRHDSWHMDFGTANVAIWRVGIAVEMGEHDDAISISRTIDRSQVRTAQRLARLHMDQGRAEFAVGNRDRAIAAFLEADRVAPIEVRTRPTVREIVGLMIRDVRRSAGSDALRDLAVRCGVDPLAVNAE